MASCGYGNALNDDKNLDARWDSGHRHRLCLRRRDSPSI